MSTPIPSSVKKQLAKGEAARQAYLQQGDTAKPAAPAPTVEAPAPPAPVAPAAPEAATLPPAPPAPVTAPFAPLAVEQQRPASPQGDLAQMQASLQQVTQSLNTLRGKYDREVPALHTANKELMAENQRLKQQAQATAAKGDEALQFFRDEVSPEYAEQMRAFVQSQVAPLQEQVQGVAQGKKEEIERDFWTAVNGAHPDWQEVNLRWKSWLLNLMPPTMEETYDEALQRGMNSRKATLVNNILTEFKKSESGGSQHATPGTGQIVLPGNSGGGGNAAPEKRQYRQSEVAAFYAEKRKLSVGQKCFYSPEQAAALENDIFAAQRDGRITPG
jgi:hypothetical protein